MSDAEGFISDYCENNVSFKEGSARQVQRQFSLSCPEIVLEEEERVDEY